MSVAQEREFLAPFLESAACAGVLVVGQIKAALDKRHPQSDPVAQTEWKKTPRGPYPNPQRLGARPTHQTDVSRRGAFWAHLARAPVLGTQTNASALPRHADA